MRHRLVIAALIFALVPLAAACSDRTGDPAADAAFDVAGQRFDCGSSGDLILDVTLFYPGPNPSLILDGHTLDAEHPGGDLFEYRPTTAPRFSCADGETHRLEIDTDHSNAIYTGCSIRLGPAVTTQYGKNPPEPSSYNAGERTCDLTWTD